MISQIRTLLRSPEIRRDYARYCLSRLSGLGAAHRQIHGIRVAGFLSFTCYRNAAEALLPNEAGYLSSVELGPGDIVDVGANYGIWTLILAHRFPERRVLSIEAHPGVFRALERNCLHNAVTNVTAINRAIWKSEGEIQFAARRVGTGGSHVHFGASDNEPSNPVPCTTLDSLLGQTGIEKVSLLKIDVEGFESCVLEGARQAMARKSIGTIVLEVCPGFSAVTGIPARKPLEMLSDHGYKLFRLTPVGLCPAVPADVDRVSLENWVAVQTD